MTDALKMAREALGELGAAHAWLAFGECRAYDAVRSGPVLSSADADAKARAAIAAIDAQQAAPTVKRYCCYGAAAEVGCDDDCPTKRAQQAATVGAPSDLLRWALKDCGATGNPEGGAYFSEYALAKLAHRLAATQPAVQAPAPLTETEATAEADRLYADDREYHTINEWFVRGIRFAERHHGIGAAAQGGE